MKVYLYKGSLRLVRKSGVGQAVVHQKEMLQKAGVEVVSSWQPGADVVHINTVFPDSVLAALRAHFWGQTVVYYGHSTMEDFRNSFVGSNLFAPFFRNWLRFCYNLGDFVLTPTPYSKQLLETYHLHVPIYNISNGIDTEFFSPSATARAAFRQKFGLSENEKVVISVGHYMQRKGILDFIDMAARMPDVTFLWFGYTDPVLVPNCVRAAMAAAPSNLRFPGFLDQAALRDAYCGADVFALMTQEETEGIVVLEALACETPVVVRDIPVYADWLTDGKQAYKAQQTGEFCEKVRGLLDGSLPRLDAAERAVAESRSIAAMGKKLKGIYQKEQVPGAAKRVGKVAHHEYVTP